MRTDHRRASTEEEQTEAAILALMLSLPHPFLRTMPELVRELETSRDDVNRALCNLIDYGLVEFVGGRSESLRVSAVARRCGRLLRAAT